MVWYAGRRLLSGVVVFLLVSGLSFVLFYARGGDAIARNFLGATSTAAEAHAAAVRLGLDRPLYIQYGDWLLGLTHGDLGSSLGTGAPVTVLLGTRIPVTLSLVLLTMLITIVIGILVGVFAAVRGGVLDRIVQVASVILGALPGYWIALILVVVFSLNLRLLPATGFIPLTTSLAGWLSTTILPAVSISLGAVLGLAVWVRSAIIDVQKKDFVRTLRSRGLSYPRIMFVHVMRNAAAPIIQMLGLQLIALLGGAIIVERVFALPGVGSLALDSGTTGDVPVVLGCVTFLVAVVVVTNLIVDLVNGFLNPRVRLA